jgi:uncharacterized glyoxalase superfamily protein PhnB
MAKVALEATVAPGITANDLAKSTHFYVEGLGFTITRRNEVDGQLRFVMLQAGNAELGIGQDDFAKGKNRVKGTGMRLWLTTGQDLSALAARAKAAGLTLDHDVMELPWGQRAFALTDPDGFKLTIAARMTG